MKTFNQFCAEAYQLDENPITQQKPNLKTTRVPSPSKSLPKPSPVGFWSRLGRVVNPALTVVDIGHNFNKITKNIGPIERTAAAAASVPGPHRPLASGVSWGMEIIPGARQVDAKLPEIATKSLNARSNAMTSRWWQMGKKF